MGKIEIPKRFKAKLKGATYVHKLCDNVLRRISARPGRMPYFQEYTIHDEEHINHVLDIADALIPTSTLNDRTFTKDAIEILISSIVVHDIGMFIQPDGLHQLLFGSLKNYKIKDVDKRTWGESWEEFFQRYKRYNDRKLNDIFGDIVPVMKLKDNEIDDKPNAWRVYGEFLRENHARLAHEIVLNGFPGNSTLDIFEKCDIKNDQRDIIGLIARSHYMKLSDAQEYERLSKYNTYFKFIPVYYLMSALRLADIIHAGERRAPEVAEEAQHIDSTKSKNEFKWNQAVYDKMLWHVRREDNTRAGILDAKRSRSVEIIAKPEDSNTFLQLEDWINTIQNELSMCWATLAEKDDCKFELSVHRLVPIITDNGEFLAKRAAVSANPDIVKQLIEPLYGNNPSYGVRELLQNAVDACNERVVWTRIENERRKKDEKMPLSCPEGLITIDVDTVSETKKLTITDNGIGMTEDVLINYYLVAGASYRENSVWREAYVGDDGKPSVMRSGRFGVGALATFLLGEKATVTTRHASDPKGYRFKYGIDDHEPLNVERVDGVEIGTKIKVALNEKSVEYFKNARDDIKWYEWYCLNKPKVKYTLNGNKINHECEIFPVEGYEATPRGEWHKVILSNGVIAYWSNLSFMPSVNYLLAKVCCNGVMTCWSSENMLGHKPLGIDYGGRINVSFFDREGVLPITLNRNDIAYISEFDNIIMDVCRYLLAKIMFLELTEDCYITDVDRHGVSTDWIIGGSWIIGDSKQLRYSNIRFNLGFSNKGFIPLLHAFFIECKIETIRCISINRPVLLHHEVINKSTAINMANDADTLTIIVKQDIRDELLTLPDEIELAGILYAVDAKYTVPIGDPQQRHKYAKYYAQSDFDETKSPMHSLIQGLLGDRNATLYSDDFWIPFDLSDRKKKFPKAYEVLKKYIKEKD